MNRFSAVLVAALAASPAFAGEGTGSFTGASNHETSGTVQVVQTDGGWEVRLGEDFTFDGAPDPYVGFGASGAFAADTDFEILRANSGAQVYMVPAGIDPAAYDEVYIWCRKFSVPLGVAQITK